MIFPILAFITVFTSAVLWMFGFIPPNTTIWDVFFSSKSFQDILVNILRGAIVAGFIYNRDEPIYGGLGVLVFQMLGLYSIFSLSVPPELAKLLLAVIGVYNFILVMSSINWIRGKGE